MARRITLDLDKLVAVHASLQVTLDTLADDLTVTTDGPAKAAADGKMTTAIRVHPARLFALKTLAHHRRVRVDALIDDAIDHYLELHGQHEIA